MSYPLAARRGVFVDVTDDDLPPVDTLGHEDSEAFKALDQLYRALCAILYNYVPQSGHPGGSISSGRIAETILFTALDYDVSRPGREDADVLSYAAGHKAMGLYAVWALRDEIMRLGAPELLPDLDQRLRLEDLLVRAALGARERLQRRKRQPRGDAPSVEVVYQLAAACSQATPAEIALHPGSVTTLRGELARALEWLNHRSRGALFVASADLLTSTSVSGIGSGFGQGYWNASGNSGSRLLSVGGICEDAISGVLSGVSSFGRHIGVGSSYGAFLAPLGHVAARLHAIGNQARRAADGEPYRPMILVCAHAGLKTGEDGTTHADPQCLQLLQGNFPLGTAITLTPWEPQEIWPLLCAALARRPALLAAFVTRPNETGLDRRAMGLAPAEDAVSGVYVLRRPARSGDGSNVLQESAVAYTFVQEVLPLLDKDGLSPAVYYVASAELFDLLPEETQRAIFPPERAHQAMGITGFTLPTMDRFIRSEIGRAHTLHPYARGHFLGSGSGQAVLAEAGLDGEGQYRAVRRYLDARARAAPRALAASA